MQYHRQQIIELEAEIDALTASAHRCERVHVEVKALTAVGAFLIVAALTRAFGFAMAGFLFVTAAALGGSVLLGSNRRTHENMLAAIEAKRVLRTELIDTLEWGASSAKDGVVVSSPSISP